MLFCYYLYNIKYEEPCAVLNLNCVAQMAVKSFRANTILGYVFLACTEYWRSSLVYSQGVIFITVTGKRLENSYTRTVSGTSVAFLRFLKFSSKLGIFTSCFSFFVFIFNKIFVLENTKHLFTEIVIEFRENNLMVLV